MAVCVYMCVIVSVHTGVLAIPSHWLRANVAAWLNIKSSEGLSLFSLLWKAIFIVFNYLRSVKADPCSLLRCLNHWRANETVLWLLKIFTVVYRCFYPACIIRVCAVICAPDWTGCRLMRLKTLKSKHTIVTLTDPQVHPRPPRDSNINTLLMLIVN